MSTPTPPAVISWSPPSARPVEGQTHGTDSTASMMKNEVRLATTGKITRSHPLATQATGARHEAPLEEQTALLHASVEARLALEAAIAASAEALLHARTMSAQLETRIAWLSAPDAGLADSVALTNLSRREKEVLALVATGYSNRAIAEALYLSPNTIKTHVSALLTKLQAETRVQLAVIAAQPGAALACQAVGHVS